jgi:hypothetical protein
MLGPVDAGHVILGAALIIVLTSHLRRRHRGQFGLTIVVKRDTTDESTSDRHGPDDGDDVTEG